MGGVKKGSGSEGVNILKEGKEGSLKKPNELKKAFGLECFSTA